MAPETDARIVEQRPERVPVDRATGESPARVIKRGVSVPSRDGHGRDTLMVDLGWDHLPGSDGAERVLVDRLLEQAAQLEAALGARIVDDTLRDTRVLGTVAAGFRAWARDWYTALDAGEVKTTGEVRPVGALPRELVSAMAGHAVTPSSAVLSVRDADIVHAHRAAKRGELDREWYAELPVHLRAPQAVLLDTTDPSRPALLYIYPAPDAQSDKLVVQVDYTVKRRREDGRRERVRMNIVNTGRRLDTGHLRAYPVLLGALD